MDTVPIRYDMPLFRPPSEGRSLILQVTIGCSWNRCSFCEMYQSKRFRPRPFAEIQAEIRAVAERLGVGRIRKVFLADGNAFVLSARRLLPILDEIHAQLDGVEQVSAYAMPSDVLRKSDDDLVRLRAAGLGMIYVGVESGDDEILQRVDKGETQAGTIEALQRAGAAGIRRSVMILNGLGGRRFSGQHAAGSAAVLNATQPEFASSLVVSFPEGQQRFLGKFGDGFEPLGQQDLFEELERLIEPLELETTEFRSNHASNYLVLKGRLNRDKDELLGRLRMARTRPEAAGLRPEWARGL